jgi:hypothetical protein
MTIVIAVLCGLVAVNFAALYWLCFRENLAVGEYAQFLLMNTDSYADQRRKFVEYLGTTADKSSTKRGTDAAKRSRVSRGICTLSYFWRIRRHVTLSREKRCRRERLRR